MDITKIAQTCMGCFSLMPVGAKFCPVCGYSESAQPPTHQLSPRSILNGKYLVGKVLGEGGFGITYIGWDLNLDVSIAVKEYYPNGFVTRESTHTSTVQPFTGSQGDFFIKGRDRFVGEARSLARFRTLPGIVAVSDFFVENGTAYIVMEYIEGQTFKSYLASMGGSIPAGQAIEMMKPVMSSLAEVHKSGMIHRDISPDNIMISSAGVMKLLDFGAARDFEESGNRSLSIMLKPGYAPEEQYRARGEQGPWTDVYALSATIYKAITGVTPDDSLERIQEDLVKPPGQLGIQMLPGQERALMKGLAVYTRDRWQSITELYNALIAGTDAPLPVQDGPQYIYDNSPASGVVENEVTGVQKKAHNEKKLAIRGVLIALPLIILIIALISLTGRSGRTADPPPTNAGSSNPPQTSQDSPQETPSQEPPQTSSNAPLQDSSQDSSEIPSQESPLPPSQSPSQPPPSPETSQAPAPAPKIQKRDFIIKDSSSRLLEAWELWQYSNAELALARNEIYARHGYMFGFKNMRDWFTEKSWYTPRLSHSEFKDTLFNDVERANIRLLSEYRDSRNRGEVDPYYGYGAEDLDDYQIFPDSSYRYLSDDEFKSISQSSDSMAFAINEIYARNGRMFDEVDRDESQITKWNEYFRSFTWYSPTIPDSRWGNWTDPKLNEFEQYNLEYLEYWAWVYRRDHPS